MGKKLLKMFLHATTCSADFGDRGISGKARRCASAAEALDYGAHYGDLVPFLRGLVPVGGVAVPARRRALAGPGFDLDAYQQAMRKRYSRLKLEELDPTTHDTRPLTLTGMFIAQSARECAEFLPRVFELPKEVQRRLREAGEIGGAELDEETLAQHQRAYRDQSPRPILEVLGEPGSSRVVVLGDPGSGKSTLLQYLLLRWAERTRARSSESRYRCSLNCVNMPDCATRAKRTASSATCTTARACVGI